MTSIKVHILILNAVLLVLVSGQEYDFAAEISRQCLVPDPVGLLDCVENKVDLPYITSWVECTNSLGQNVATSSDIINYRCKSVWEGKGVIPEVFYIKDCVIEKTGLPAKNVSAIVLGAYKECESSPGSGQRQTQQGKTSPANSPPRPISAVSPQPISQSKVQYTPVQQIQGQYNQPQPVQQIQGQYNQPQPVQQIQGQYNQPQPVQQIQGQYNQPQPVQQTQYQYTPPQAAQVQTIPLQPLYQPQAQYAPPSSRQYFTLYPSSVPPNQSSQPARQQGTGYQQAIYQQQSNQQAGYQQQPIQQAGYQQQSVQQAGYQQQPIQQAGYQQQPIQQAGYQQQPVQQAGYQQQSIQQAGYQQKAIQQAGYQQKAIQQAGYQQQPNQIAGYQQLMYVPQPANAYYYTFSTTHPHSKKQ